MNNEAQEYNNWVIHAGATFQRVITYLQPDGTTPVDLTGYGATLKIAASYSHETILASLSVGSGISINTGTGAITITLTPTQTSELEADGSPEDLVYNLNLTQGGNVYPLLFGKMKLKQMVS